jgi:hypothetical protein
MSPPSFSLGFAFTLLAIYLFLESRYIMFLLAMTCLLLIKASFFLPLLGGVILYFLRTKEYKKLLLYSLPLSGAFLIGYKLFMSGAHEHNHWMIFPTFIFLLFRTHEMITAEGLMWLVIICLWSIALLKMYFKSQTNQSQLWLISICLSGTLICCLLTERMEFNSIQFYMAFFFPTIILIWHFIKNRATKNPNYLMLMGVLLFLTIESVTTQTLRHINHLKSLTCCRDSLLPRDLNSAYTWLGKNIPNTSIVLYGKHYEIIDFYFIRSALSGKQMLCENDFLKGIAMDNRYPKRSADNINLYNSFVIPSEESKKELQFFFKEKLSDTPGVPLNLEPGPQKQLFTS